MIWQSGREVGHGAYCIGCGQRDGIDCQMGLEKRRYLASNAHHAHVFDLQSDCRLNILASGTKHFYYSSLDAKGTTTETSKSMLDGHVASNLPHPWQYLICSMMKIDSG
jgi:hypothetical protein